MRQHEAPQHHLDVRTRDVGRYVLLPGDPERCKKIAAYFDDPKLVAQKREFTTYTGTLLDEPVSVVSTGIGCPSAAICVEELIAVGADTFIRVGTSGAIQPATRTGDIAIVTGAIRDEGTTSQYMPMEFPAVADPDVVLALREAVRRLDLPHAVGITQSKDSFYGEVEPGRMPVAHRLHTRWQAWTAGGAICSEMEAAAIFIISSIHKMRAGGVMLMAAVSETAPETDEERRLRAARFDIDRAIRTAIEGLKLLIEMDRNTVGRDS